MKKMMAGLMIGIAFVFLIGAGSAGPPPVAWEQDCFGALEVEPLSGAGNHVRCFGPTATATASPTATASATPLPTVTEMETATAVPTLAPACFGVTLAKESETLFSVNNADATDHKVTRLWITWSGAARLTSISMGGEVIASFGTGVAQPSDNYFDSVSVAARTLAPAESKMISLAFDGVPMAVFVSAELDFVCSVYAGPIP